MIFGLLILYSVYLSMEEKSTSSSRSEEELLLKLEDKRLPCYVDDSCASITVVLIFSIFNAVCGSFVMGCAMVYTSPVQSEIMEDLGLTTADYSLFGSIITIGGLITSMLCGKITDYLGRRGTMGLSSTLYLIGWFAIAFSQHAWSLDLGRLILGFAGGLTTYVVPIYISEITPKNFRGGAVLLQQLMASCGMAFVYLAGLITNWRGLALIGALPCLMQLLGLLFIPESPRWLVKVGHDEVYKVALRSLRGNNMDISHEAAEIKECNKVVENVSENSFLSVFQMKYAYALTVSLGLMALAGFGGASGIMFYATTIFESAGFSGTMGTVAMALTQLPSTILGVFLMDKYGRRPLLLCSAIGMCIACVSVALSFLMKEHGWMKDFSPYLALIGIVVSSATFPIGLGGIPWLITSEIFPMNVKGAAGSLANVVNALTAWTVSYTFNFLMDWRSSGTFFIYASIDVLALLFILILVPETKGRTLEEIQESLTRTVF